MATNPFAPAVDFPYDEDWRRRAFMQNLPQPPHYQPELARGQYAAEPYEYPQYEPEPYYQQVPRGVREPMFTGPAANWARRAFGGPEAQVSQDAYDWRRERQLEAQDARQERSLMYMRGVPNAPEAAAANDAELLQRGDEARAQRLSNKDAPIPPTPQPNDARGVFVQGPDGTSIPWQSGQDVGFTAEDAAQARSAFAPQAIDAYGNPLGQHRYGPQPWMVATDVGGAGIQLGSPQAEQLAQRQAAFAPGYIPSATERRGEGGLTKDRTRTAVEGRAEQRFTERQRQEDRAYSERMAKMREASETERTRMTTEQGQAQAQAEQRYRTQEAQVERRNSLERLGVEKGMAAQISADADARKARIAAIDSLRDVYLGKKPSARVKWLNELREATPALYKTFVEVNGIGT